MLLFSHTQSRTLHAFPVIHHRFILILGIEGRGGVIVDGKLHPIEANRGVLVFPFQQHCYARADDEKILWLFIGFEFDDSETHASLGNRGLSLNTDHWHLVEKLTIAFNHSLKHPATGQTVSLWLSLLMVSLTDSIRESAPSVHPPTTKLQQTIQKMAQFVIQNVQQPITLSQIARTVGVSESHLRRICHQNLELSLGRFVRRVRISHACNLLCNTEEPVTKVAANSGFSSLYSFSRTFKKETGMAPLKYRQKEWLSQPPKAGR